MNETRADAPNSEITPEERRQYVRVRGQMRVAFEVIGEPSAEGVAAGRNLATGGIMITSQGPLKLGTRLQLTVTMKHADVELSMGGRVVWCEYNGGLGKYEAGVCFVGLDEAQRQNVTAFVGANLPGAKGLERRHFIRLRRRLIAEYRLGMPLLHRWRTASTEDICVGGLAMRTRDRLSQGETIHVRVHLDDRAEAPLRAKGVVVHCSSAKGHPGEWIAHVKFRDAEGVPRQRLADYISKCMSAPAMERVTRLPADKQAVPAGHKDENAGSES